MFQRLRSTIPLIWIGVFWKIFSCACFAGVNALVRYLSGGSSIAIENPLPIYIIMLFQNLFGTVFILPWMLQNKHHFSITNTYPKLHIIRVVTAVLGVALWYLSLRFIPIAQAVALSFAGPIVTVIGATLFLKEKLTFYRWLAVLFSLLGGFLIIQPDRGLNANSLGLSALLPLASACIFAFDKLITRKILAKHDSSALLTLYLLAFMSPMCLLPTFVYGWVSPCTSQWPWLLLLGFLGTLAHFSFGKAYALAEVTFLMPFGISKFLLCGLIGLIAFGEMPKTVPLWSGIIMITLSTMVLNLKKTPTFQRLRKAKLLNQSS